MPFKAILGPFVRGIWESGANFWIELDRAAEVRIEVAPEGGRAAFRPTQQPTVRLGRRHFAMVTVEDLKPGSWYVYRASIIDNGLAQALEEHRLPGMRGQLFRTMEAGPWDGRYRFAHASCRIARHSAEGSGHGGGDGPDVLSMMAGWLGARATRRDSEWPRFLLLTGDQIYADDCDDFIISRIEEKRRRHASPPPLPSLAGTTPGPGRAGRRDIHPSDFEEYAIVYEHSWNFPGVQQVLANLPSFMIFDDHEVGDDWNITEAWRRQTRHGPWRQAIVGALAAYWIYQGWGNLDPESLESDPRVQLLEQARGSGFDALALLEQLIEGTLSAPGLLQWHYRVRTPFPLMVADTRTERSMPRIDNLAAQRRAEIMSVQQMQSITVPFREGAGFALVVTPGPFLVWPLVTVVGAGFRLGMTGDNAGLLTKILGEVSTGVSSALPADIREALIRKMDLEFWPVFFDSFKRIADFSRRLEAQGQVLIFLTGDVHTAFNMSAAPEGSSPSATRRTPILQLVGSSLQNPPPAWKRKALKYGGTVRMASFGGLTFTYIPFPKGDFFYDNNIALVDLVRDSRGVWLHQQYLTAIRNGELGVTRKMRAPAGGGLMTIAQIQQRGTRIQKRARSGHIDSGVVMPMSVRVRARAVLAAWHSFRRALVRASSAGSPETTRQWS